MADKIQLRRDIAANWTATNPTLGVGEVGLIIDANSKTVGLKYGDGVSTWADLEEFGGGGSGGGSGYMLIVDSVSYNADSTIKILKQKYVDDPTKFYEQRFEYTSGVASKIEIKDDMNSKWVSHTNIYDGNGQLQAPTITTITAWTII
jgi:hypothetical protein